MLEVHYDNITVGTLKNSERWDVTWCVFNEREDKDKKLKYKLRIMMVVSLRFLDCTQHIISLDYVQSQDGSKSL